MVAITTASEIPVEKIAKSPGFWSGVLRRLCRDPVAMAALALRSPGADRYLRTVSCAVRPGEGQCDPSSETDWNRGIHSWNRRTRARYAVAFDPWCTAVLIMGVVPVPIAFVIGSAIGIIAGYAGGLTNTLIMRTVDVFYAFPSVLLAVALSGALGSGLTNALVSLTVVFIPQIARVAESVTTQVRKLDYVDAARASGAPAFTIIRVHILGNVLGPIFVFATSLISVSMILASGLSFLGLGVRPPDAEWGLCSIRCARRFIPIPSSRLFPA